MNESATCICGTALVRQHFSKNFDALGCIACGSKHFAPTSVDGAREFRYDGNNGKYAEASYLYGKQLRWAHGQLLRRPWGGKKVLEIGCFNGFFLDELMKAGADAYGFDVNEAALAVGRKLFGLDGRLFSSLETPRANGPYDVIICIDMLEHLDAPEDFLREVGSILADGGHLVIAGPTLERRFHDKSDYPPHQVS